MPSTPPAPVFLVGGGPGDPGLITVRGRDLLARAELVLYDYLCNERLLAHAPDSAERICLGRHGVGKLWSQDEINRAMVEAALAGRTVVRLKGGDPAIFGRLAEETSALRAAGVPFEVVPGVTAASAAAAYSTIPITDKARASAVAFVTGQEALAKAESRLDFAALAAFPGTLAVYMGVTTAPVWTEALMAAGRSGETPVAIVRQVSLPTQRTIRCRLDEVAGHLTPASKLRPPVLVLIGQVTAPPAAVGWFEARPLSGRTVLVPRAEQQSGGLADRLAELGAQVLLQPTITITARPPEGDFADALAALPETDWVVFASRNGVAAFFAGLRASGRDLRALGRSRLAVVGPGTAEALAEWHLTADVIPEGPYNADSLADALASRVDGRRVLLIQANRSRPTLLERLRAAGADVRTAVVYDSDDVTEVAPEILTAVKEQSIDDVVVTSPAVATALVDWCGPDLAAIRRVAISPLTAAELERLGHPATVVAAEATLDGVVEALLTLPPREGPMDAGSRGAD